MTGTLSETGTVREEDVVGRQTAERESRLWYATCVARRAAGGDTHSRAYVKAVQGRGIMSGGGNTRR